MVLKSDLKICNGYDWGIKYFGNFARITAKGVGCRFLPFYMTKKDVIEFIKDFEPYELQKHCSMK